MPVNQCVYFIVQHHPFIVVAVVVVAAVVVVCQFFWFDGFQFMFQRSDRNILRLRIQDCITKQTSIMIIAVHLVFNLMPTDSFRPDIFLAIKLILYIRLGAECENINHNLPLCLIGKQSWDILSFILPCFFFNNWPCNSIGSN